MMDVSEDYTVLHLRMYVSRVYRHFGLSLDGEKLIDDSVPFSNLPHAGIEINECNCEECLIYVLKRYNNDIVDESILEYIEDVDFEYTALMIAIEFGTIEMVRDILDRNPDINAVDKFGYTALMVCAMFGYPGIDLVIREILEHKPDIDAINKDGKTALMVAIDYDSYTATRIILEHPLNIDVVNEKHETALMQAIGSADYQNVAAILKLKPNVNLVNIANESALMIAVEHASLEIVQAILEHEPDVNLVNIDKESALMIANRCGMIEKAECITRYINTKLHVPPFVHNNV